MRFLVAGLAATLLYSIPSWAQSVPANGVLGEYLMWGPSGPVWTSPPTFTGTNEVLTVDGASHVGGIPLASLGGATSVTFNLVPRVDPNLADIVVGLPAAYTISSAVFRLEFPLMNPGTIALFSAPNGTPCGGGTPIASNSFIANGAAMVAHNQVLNLTAPSIPAGSTLCLRTTGGNAWGAGSGRGAITVYMNPS